MHVLFVHKNYPAQFGHVAKYLIDEHDFRCTFVSEKPPSKSHNFERLQYRPKSGATERTNFYSRSFENQVWHSDALFQTLRARPDIQPDLIVGHTGFVSTLYLRELYDCPIINYFEFFYHPHNSDLDFRKDLPGYDIPEFLRARTRNAMFLLDLHNCDAGYCPTNFQRQQLPNEYQSKLHTIFDGIDTRIWRRAENPGRKVATWTLPEDKQVITYVSRGMEAMRGFDIFMKIAKRLCDERDDVVFVVVGEDRIAYGGDRRFTGDKTFKQWVLSQDDYDLERILFVGRLAPTELASLLSLSNLHIYLTVPFVLSWSLMNALACGAPVLASRTPPVEEVVTHKHNGLLFDFFDPDEAVALAHELLASDQYKRAYRESSMAQIRDHYSLDICLPKMLELYRLVCS